MAQPVTAPDRLREVPRNPRGCVEQRTVCSQASRGRMRKWSPDRSGPATDVLDAAALPVMQLVRGMKS